MTREEFGSVAGRLGVLLQTVGSRCAHHSASSVVSPLHDRVHQVSDPPRRIGFAIVDPPWLGPQTALEGRPPALMEAGAGGRCAASLFEAQLYCAGHRVTRSSF